MHYYNDVANDCTYGIGTLVHKGPCTADELKTPVTASAVDIQLSAKIHVAEAAVRRVVKSGKVTQAQFDALVSYTYNVGARGANPVLRAANAGRDAQVVRDMDGMVYVHPVEPNGRRLPARRVPGLVYRRRGESAPFRTHAVEARR